MSIVFYSVKDGFNGGRLLFLVLHKHLEPRGLHLRLTEMQ